MRNGTRKRSRPEIEPIRVKELLAGAGMTGFLSVLQPPVAVPHLGKLAGVAPPSPAGIAAPTQFRVDVLLRRLDGQQESLSAMHAQANRWRFRVEQLYRRAEEFRLLRSGG